jgi:hypothetical protein
MAAGNARSALGLYSWSSAAGRNAITTERASMSRRIIASYVNEFYSGEGEGLVNIDVIVERNANVEFGYSVARYPRSY